MADRSSASLRSLPAGVSPRLLVVTAGLLWSACGSLGPAPGAPVEDVAELKRRIVELQRQATVSEVEAARLREEVAALERELADARRTARPERAQPAGDTGEEDVEIGPITLTEGIEESELEEPPPSAPPVQPEPAGERPQGPSREAIALYDEGYVLYHQERYAEAQTRFESFLEGYPDTDLADNALFWIGESHYARSDYDAALEAFTETIERFPEGNKVPDALLKAGKCLEALGRKAQARDTYQEVAERFPSSAAAAVARERLAALR